MCKTTFAFLFQAISIGLQILIFLNLLKDNQVIATIFKEFIESRFKEISIPT